jgi:four helix bundle protein
VKATCVEDLLVYQRSIRLMSAVFGLTHHFRSDFWLADQLKSSTESAVSNISEGFVQLTDRGFARYLAIAAGSIEESRAHLAAAWTKGLVPDQRCHELRQEGLEIVRMLHALIAYLQRCDRKNRLTPPGKTR